MSTESHAVVTVESLTAELIRAASDRWPELISSERSATALGLPESLTSGGLPLYPQRREIYHARHYIARLITLRWSEPSNEHAPLVSITNHPNDPAEVRLAHELADGDA